MDKANDTMTICTLARPDKITIGTREYRDLLRAQDQYEDLLELMLQSISIDSDGKPDIEYKNRITLLAVLGIIEKEAFNMRVRQLREQALKGGE